MRQHPGYMTRRTLSGALLLSPLAVALRVAAVESTPIEVWTGPSCSCCHDWVKHLETNGFSVTTHDGGNLDARSRLGIPINFGSCHTAKVGGFAIEGHVSADEIRRLLGERPDAIGLAVPSMPLGSPGMDGPAYGGARNPYDVFLIRRDGSAVVYSSHR
jgi:hypothetical protein